MTRISNQKTYTVRTLALAAFIALICSAQADLKMSVSVSGTGVASSGAQQAGSYEVDFRGSQARIVTPSGTSKIFDFNTSQMAVLNANTKTYTLETLTNVLAPGPGPKLSASLVADHATSPQTKFGAKAQKMTIASTSSDKAKAAKVGSAPPISAYTTINYSGSAWLADGSAVRSSIGSVSPLVLIGAPQALVSSITDYLDENGEIPLSCAFTWLDSAGQKSTLNMTVGAIDASSLDPAMFTIPADYKEVQKLGSN